MMGVAVSAPKIQGEAVAWLGLTPRPSRPCLGWPLTLIRLTADQDFDGHLTDRRERFLASLPGRPPIESIPDA